MTTAIASTMTAMKITAATTNAMTTTTTMMVMVIVNKLMTIIMKMMAMVMKLKNKNNDGDNDFDFTDDGPSHPTNPDGVHTVANASATPAQPSIAKITTETIRQSLATMASQNRNKRHA